MNQAGMTFQNHQFLISGEINFSNVMSLYLQSLPQLKQCPTWHFDFSQVIASDSTGLALIIEWIKLAKQLHKPIHLTHLSEELISIAKAAGLEKMINPS